jgi:hypothetical protein
VTNIVNAFPGCSSLKSFSVASGNPAYRSVDGLLLSQDGKILVCGINGDVAIPDGVKNISAYAFYTYTGLTSVAIPDSVTDIGNSAFVGCSGLTSVTIGNGVTSVGDYAFKSCSNLVSVTILGNVTNDWSASYYSPFYECPNVETVVLGGNMTKIGNYMFSGCSGLTNVVIPDGVTNIGDYAFQNCAGLASVTILDGVTNIGNYAFSNCGNLTTVTIPDSVVDLSTTAFDGCSKLWTAWYRTLANLSAEGGTSGGASSGGGRQSVSLSVTNVVVHYVMRSVQSDAVIPDTSSPGIVNVIAEVAAPKALAIPSGWADQYPGFEAAFGSDFASAVVKETGKRDGSGNAMFVWQDFVAGTDPTDPTSVFTASLTFDAETGDPIVSWSPELSPEEAAKRIYTVSGKERMTDEEWTVLDGNAAGLNFFRVTVEMR